MAAVSFVVPGRLDALTGGSIYDRRIVEGLRARGWTVDVHELGDGFPQPGPQAITEARRALAGLADGTTTIVDGLTLGAIPEIVAHEARRLRIVALVHLPLALEIGIDDALTRRLEESERRALAAVDRVIITGRSTVDAVVALGVPRDRIAVVEPGTDRATIASGGDGRIVRLLSVATLSPGKGHELLIGALASIDADNWVLTCVGSTTRYPATVDRVRACVRSAGLDDRVTLVGERAGSELAQHYAQSDLFVLATLRETYGMAVAEALACGLPIVSTTTGAIPQLVGEDAGLLVPVGDRVALAGALSRVLSDAALRARLAAGARRVRERLESWEIAAGKMAAVLEQVAVHG
jgi:glycosyltransferase involved in cell wall biosynthesis